MRFTGERVLPDLPELRSTYLQSLAVYEYALEHVREKDVLDCGAGEGYGPALLASAASSVVGLDASDEAVDHATAKYGDTPGLRFIRGDAGDLPFPDDSVDVVCCFQVLEHLEDATGFLFEARRVLRPGGQLLLTTPNRLAAGTGPNPHHVLEYSAAELDELLSIVFPEEVAILGVFGSERVMQYRAKNQRIVRWLMRLDFFGLRYRLPERIREPVHASLTRRIRGFTRKQSGNAVDELTTADFPVRNGNVDRSIDLLAVAVKRV